MTSIDIKAAVLRERGGAFAIEALRLNPREAGEVLVEIEACGICHTDLMIRDGGYPTPLPVVLGHEGAGVVRAVGDGAASPSATRCSCPTPPAASARAATRARPPVAGATWR
ncbi:MAG: alcohol dehydrogenase catalytic domain-containing protein [Amaricoccus sp.]|nr:alcohol dehydrogenase catalytic domain-containing protein [Amaricoccus sp.]